MLKLLDEPILVARRRPHKGRRPDYEVFDRHGTSVARGVYLQDDERKPLMRAVRARAPDRGRPPGHRRCRRHSGYYVHIQAPLPEPLRSVIVAFAIALQAAIGSETSAEETDVLKLSFIPRFLDPLRRRGAAPAR